MKTSETVWFMLVIAAASAGAGLLYALLVTGSRPEVAMVYGLCVGSTVSAFERGLIAPELQRRIRHWPTLLYGPASLAAYLGLILLGNALGGSIVWSTGLIGSTSFVDSVVPTLQVLIYSIAVSALFVFVLRVRDLLGREVFANLLIGRYHRPVEEDRIFLFLDLVGSTAYARTHGDLRAQDYLGAIFETIAEPVRRHAGTIDDYIGDMAMITWPSARGLQDGRCLRCVFAILDQFDREAATWRDRFGQVPTFRAALHGGSVVTAEVGIDRHKISYFGDVVNTTARIETLCRQLDRPVLISVDLLQQCGPLPATIRAQTCGSHVLRGRDQQLEVFCLDRGDASDPDRAKAAALSLAVDRAG